MRPDRISIIISGTLRGTDPMPHADNASTFCLSPTCSMVIGRRQSGDFRIFFSGGMGVSLQVPYLASHGLVK